MADEIVSFHLAILLYKVWTLYWQSGLDHFQATSILQTAWLSMGTRISFYSYDHETQVCILWKKTKWLATLLTPGEQNSKLYKCSWSAIRVVIVFVALFLFWVRVCFIARTGLQFDYKHTPPHLVPGGYFDPHLWVQITVLTKDLLSWALCNGFINLSGLRNLDLSVATDIHHFLPNSKSQN